ncbi:MAG: hypothetical protein ABID87_06465 [Chloroflexota bacterium]
MNCSRCGQQVPESQGHAYEGRLLCDDCLMEVGLHPHECEPWATFLAARERRGLQGTQGLTDPQRQVYEFIKTMGKTTRDAVKTHFKFSEAELDAQLSTLMHAELVKERGEGGELHLVTIN